jgi:hypothetical protein
VDVEDGVETARWMGTSKFAMGAPHGTSLTSDTEVEKIIVNTYSFIIPNSHSYLYYLRVYIKRYFQNSLSSEIIIILLMMCDLDEPKHDKRQDH